MDTIASVWRRYLPVVYLGVFFVVFFLKELFGARVFACCDNMLIHVPIKSFLASELREGRFPLWNPFVYAGTPLLADMNNSVLAPFGLLYLIFDPFVAITINLMVSFFLASVGMYAFLRSRDLAPIASLVGAILFGYSGTLVWSADDLPVTQAIAWLPWMMWAWHRVLVQPTVKRMNVVILLAVLQILSGHPHVIYMSWLVMAVYASVVGGARRGWLLLPVFCLVVLVGAVQIVPFLEYVGLTARGASDIAFAQTDSLAWADMLRFLLPNLGGVLAHATAWWEGGNVNGYIGITGLLFAILGTRKKEARLFLILGIVGLVVALGARTPLFYALYHGLPGFSLFRSPANYLLVYSFGMAALAAYGAVYLIDNLRQMRIWKIVWGTLIIGMMVLAVGAFVYFYPGVMPNIVAGMPTAAVSDVRVNLFGSGTALIALSVVLLVSRMRASFLWALPLVVGIELVLFSKNMLVTTPLSEVKKWTEEGSALVHIMPEADWRQHRFHVRPSLFVRPNRQELDVEKTAAWTAQSLWANVGMMHGLATTDGTAAMSIGQYRLAIDSDVQKARVAGPLIIPPWLLRPLGVRYIVGNRTDYEELTSLGYASSVRTEDIWLYERADVAPRLFVDVKGADIAVDAYTPTMISATVKSPTAASVVFSDIFYPGWTATVDGRAVSIKRYQEILKAVPIAAGEHEVVFRFDPPSVTWGIVGSVAGLTLLGVLYLSPLRRRIDTVLS
jgi:hypothetical protein